MASISPVILSVGDVPESDGRFRVIVSYTITGTAHDCESGLTYQELVQLVQVGGQPGPGHGGEHVLPDAKFPDSTVTFSLSEVAFVHEPEVALPPSALRDDPALLHDTSIRARVTLTPLPRTQESDVKVLPGVAPPVASG